MVMGKKTDFVFSTNMQTSDKDLLVRLVMRFNSKNKDERFHRNFKTLERRFTALAEACCADLEIRFEVENFGGVYSVRGQVSSHTFHKVFVGPEKYGDRLQDTVIAVLDVIVEEMAYEDACDLLEYKEKVGEGDPELKQIRRETLEFMSNWS